MMVTDDKNPDRGGLDSIEKMIGKTLQIGASQIVDKEMKPPWILQNQVEAYNRSGLKFLSQMNSALLLIECADAL